MPTTRSLALDDAADLATLLTQDRVALAPTSPVRDETWFTEAGQRARLLALQLERDLGTTVSLAITGAAGGLVGQVTLSEVVRGPLQACAVGYWVATRAQGRGLATAALREAVALAFGELGLHRVQAGTLLDNHRSRAVLRRVGFEEIGVARSYLLIAGRWQDHLLHQLVAPG